MKDDKKYDRNTIILTLSITLVIIGSLNWGLSVFDYNLVEMIGGKDSTFTKSVYLAVAFSSLILSYALFTNKMKIKC